VTLAATDGCRAAQVSSRTHVPQKVTGSISISTQSGTDLKCPYSNRPLKALTRFTGLWQGLFSGTHRNPLIKLISP
jgi:hypothetical protein